jgi:hypothetical protein
MIPSLSLGLSPAWAGKLHQSCTSTVGGFSAVIRWVIFAHPDQEEEDTTLRLSEVLGCLREWVLEIRLTPSPQRRSVCKILWQKRPCQRLLQA